VTWSINIVGHEDSPDAGANIWYSSRKTTTGKNLSFIGAPEEVAEKAVAFIRQCQAEEASASVPVEAAPAEAPAEAESESSEPEVPLLADLSEDVVY
jgi:hypothetical protein